MKSQVKLPNNLLTSKSNFCFKPKLRKYNKNCIAPQAEFSSPPQQGNVQGPSLDPFQPILAWQRPNFLRVYVSLSFTTQNFSGG